tara:strand:- start:371 stop:3256 length:2886 start_codon:yes stop_codon:yes gene_type:complete
MAEQIISPGVFTRENDLSFLPQGVGAIGAAIIGPTEKGPAFVPTVVRSFQEFETRFGPLSSETYVPQTVREYLKNAGSVTVCRVLAGAPYTYENGTNEVIALIASSSQDSTAVLMGAIFPSKNTSKPGLGLSSLDGGSGVVSSGTKLSENFSLILSGTNVTADQYSASLNPANSNYVFKQISDNPNNSKTGANTYKGTGFTYLNFKNKQTNIFGGAQEVATITFAADDSDNLFATASIQGTAGFGNSFVLTDADGDQFTFALSGALGFVAPTGAGLTGSLVTADISGAQHLVTGSEVANALATAINNRPEFTAVTASDGLTITVTHTSGGVATDIINQGFTTSSIVSVDTTTQGTDAIGLSNADFVYLVTQSTDITFNGEISQTEGYGYASTPFITSQFLDSSNTTKELFKIHTLDHGKEVAKDYKVSISNLKEPGNIDGVEQYSTFTVSIRAFDNLDKSNSPLEQYNNVNLDPDSPNFISRRIGDRYPQYNDTLNKVELLGNYPNISKLVRVEVAQAVAEKANSPKLSPKGFKAVKNTLNTASFADNFAFPSASYEGNQVIGSNYSSKAFLGFKFTEKDSDNDNFIKPLPSNVGSNVSGDFNVENYSGHPSSSLWVGSLSASIDATGATGPTNNQLKFTVPFQGGDDGIRPDIVKQVGEYITATNLYGFDLSTTSAGGYTGYKKALDILSNQDEYDINMLAMPGVIHSLHPLVTNAGIDMVEDRGDAFFVMDASTVDSSVNTAVSNVSGLDTSYAATYYPWVKVLDSSINKPVLVPPSVIVPGAIAASDRIGAEWFAPAGLNRGILGNVIEAKIRLNQSERDVLYDAKINPIATFPATGVCIWGQKTLQERATALDRINVRRLLINLKKFIASSSRFLVFEQNTTQTRNRFLNIVNPYLESVQSRQGLFAFRVQMDGGNNTPDVIDRNQLVGSIFLQPTKTAEFIVLDFNVLPTGATFDS